MKSRTGAGLGIAVAQYSVILGTICGTPQRNRATDTTHRRTHNRGVRALEGNAGTDGLSWYKVQSAPSASGTRMKRGGRAPLGRQRWSRCKALNSPQERGGKGQERSLRE